MSNSKTKKKGAPSGAPSRTGGRAARRKAAGSGVVQRLAAPVALVLAALIAVGSLGWWIQSKGLTPDPALSQNKPSTTTPSTTPSATVPQTTPPQTPPAKSTTLPDGRPAAWAHLDRAAGASQTMLETLYWVDGRTGDRLQPIEVRVPKSTGRARAVVEQLLSPPREIQLESGIPAGTKINDVRLNGAVLIVDLSKEVESVQGSAGASAIMASLVYSLTEIPEVKSVKLTVGGKPAILHGIDWTDAISRKQMADRNLFPVDNVIRFDGL